MPKGQELRYQGLIKDAVIEHGGFCFKLTNRFTGGIPDLLVQLKGLPTALWEVKYQAAPDLLLRSLSVTVLQKKTLRNYARSGGIGGVISITKGGVGGILRATVKLTQEFDYEGDLARNWLAPFAEYSLIPRGSGFAPIVLLIREAHERHVSGHYRNPTNPRPKLWRLSTDVLASPRLEIPDTLGTDLGQSVGGSEGDD